MLPAIGSISALAGQGRVGVVVSAQAVGEPEGGRQLMSLRIKESRDDDDARPGLGRVDRAASAASSLAPGAGASIDSTSNASTSNAHASKAGASALDRPINPSFQAARLPDELSPAEKASVAELQQRDQQVRQEENAHAAVAGDLAGPINYVYQLGPDGRQYAVGGSVGIQTSVTSGDPAEAKRQAGRVAAAANAATNPSAQDYAVARQAYALGSQLGAPQPHNELSSSTNMVL